MISKAGDAKLSVKKMDGVPRHGLFDTTNRGGGGVFVGVRTPVNDECSIVFGNVHNMFRITHFF